MYQKNQPVNYKNRLFSMTEFHQENITGTPKFSAALIEHLNNGKPLSLLVDGIYSHVRSNGKP